MIVKESQQGGQSVAGVWVRLHNYWGKVEREFDFRSLPELPLLLSSVILAYFFPVMYANFASC